MVDTINEAEVQFSKAIGTPTAVLLPARNYKFKVFQGDFTITIPRKGKYVDLESTMFSEEDGEFNFMSYDNSKKQHTIYMPALSKILFAVSQYPHMEDNQAFTPIALVIKKDTVDIVGNLIEMIDKDPSNNGI